MEILHLTEWVSAGSGGLVTVVILLLRFAWRRGKKLQEP
jgi:hypothetical protein